MEGQMIQMGFFSFFLVGGEKMSPSRHTMGRKKFEVFVFSQ